MYDKLIIRTDLKVLTGMHIGGSSAFSAIGAVDSPVVADPATKRPIVPGSSLKGKLRTLLVRASAADITKLPEPNGDDLTVRRLFGSSGSPIVKSRLQFADAFLTNAEDLKETGLTEVKFENTISRSDAVANPRQIERVVSGAVFGCCIVYDAENEAEIPEDMQNLTKAMKLLQMDYLGGHGTRGSGRVSFENIRLETAENSLSGQLLEKVRALFKEVEGYALLSV